MLLTELNQKTILKLKEAGIASNEAAIETNILLNYVFEVTKKDLILYPEKILEPDKLDFFNSLVNKRINEKIPVQYLTNKAFFMGKDFYVDENVLIPRPETELLVEEVINLIKKNNPKILDIGTGSGCIACMLAKKIENAEIFACDISKKALETAELNSKRLGITDKITFFRSDIFEKIKGNFDVIVSNPPYISINEKDNLQKEVVLHEPHQALFTEDEKGISFYEKLISQAKNHLCKDGILAVEIGINQAFDVSEIFKQNNFKEIKVIKDYSQIERVITGKLK